MAEEKTKKVEQKETNAKVFVVSSSPHIAEAATSQKIMFEVSVGCVPAMFVAIYIFGASAAMILATCMIGALGTEFIFNYARGKEQTGWDGSGMVTALILGLSLPPTFPVWAAFIGVIVAVGVGKMLFGGLGANIFNPAMVGRAFLMACFGMMMTTWAAPQRVLPWSQTSIYDSTIEVTAPEDAVTAATPLAQAKQSIKDAANPDKPADQKAVADSANENLYEMFMGDVGGSLGETSAICWLIGGLFLLWRRTITWHIPVAVLGSAMAIASGAWLMDPNIYVNPLVHLCGGGLMMCAFFIATDPVSCPLTRQGRLIFGVGVGGLIMLIRLKGGYPEGVMYAILLMNGMSPLLDRWTRPRPLGGHSRG